MITFGSRTADKRCQSLANEHRPITTDWAAKFGLPAQSPPTRTPASRAARQPTSFTQIGADAAPARRPTAAPGQPAAQGTEAKKSKLTCAACGIPVSYSVAKFCWFNKPRFGGLIYCMDCQKNVPKAG